MGQLRHLEGIQADGCLLAAPYAALYAKDPLLLVALMNSEALSLDLSDCGLDAVPADLLQQTQLTSLNLSKNNIQVRVWRLVAGVHKSFVSIIRVIVALDRQLKCWVCCCVCCCVSRSFHLALDTCGS